VVWITTAGVQTAGQSTQNGGPSEEVTPVPLLQPGASEDEIFAHLVKQNELRNAQLQEYSAVGIYAVMNPRGKAHAKEIFRMEYIALDKKTFVKISEERAHLIDRMVLIPLTESEASAAAGKA